MTVELHMDPLLVIDIETLFLLTYIDLMIRPRSLSAFAVEVGALLPSVRTRSEGTNRSLLEAASNAQEVAPVNRDPICTDRLPCERVERPVVGVVQRIADSCIRPRCRVRIVLLKRQRGPAIPRRTRRKIAAPQNPRLKRLQGPSGEHNYGDSDRFSFTDLAVPVAVVHVLVSGVILRDGSLESTGPRHKSAPEVPRCLLPLVRRGPLRWSWFGWVGCEKMGRL